MTKPDVWSRILKFQEISALSTGCGITTSPDIALEHTNMSHVEILSFKNGECITGKGKCCIAKGRENKAL